MANRSPPTPTSGPAATNPDQGSRWSLGLALPPRPTSSKATGHFLDGSPNTPARNYLPEPLTTLGVAGRHKPLLSDPARMLCSRPSAPEAAFSRRPSDLRLSTANGPDVKAHHGLDRVNIEGVLLIRGAGWPVIAGHDAIFRAGDGCRDVIGSATTVPPPPPVGSRYRPESVIKDIGKEGGVAMANSIRKDQRDAQPILDVLRGVGVVGMAILLIVLVVIVFQPVV